MLFQSRRAPALGRSSQAIFYLFYRQKNLVYSDLWKEPSAFKYCHLVGVKFPGWQEKMDFCSWMDFSPSQLPKDTLSAPKDSGAAGAERDWGMGAGKWINPCRINKSLQNEWIPAGTEELWCSWNFTQNSQRDPSVPLLMVTGQPQLFNNVSAIIIN